MGRSRPCRGARSAKASGRASAFSCAAAISLIRRSKRPSSRDGTGRGARHDRRADRARSCLAGAGISWCLLRSLLLARLGGHAARSPEKLDPTLMATIEAGRAYSAADLCEAQFARTNCFAKVQEILSRFDLIASPTLSAPALPVWARSARARRDRRARCRHHPRRMVPLHIPLQPDGTPAISLPCGLSKRPADRPSTRRPMARGRLPARCRGPHRGGSRFLRRSAGIAWGGLTLGSGSA